MFYLYYGKASTNLNPKLIKFSLKKKFIEKFQYIRVYTQTTSLYKHSFIPFNYLDPKVYEGKKFLSISNILVRKKNDILVTSGSF